MIKLKDLITEESINEVGKLVHRINKPAVETFIKKYPKVKEVMKTLILKNKDVMKGYKAFIKFKDKNEGYLGGRAEKTDSKTFGSKIFYKYDWNGIGGWAEVYEYLYDTQDESVNEATTSWSKMMQGVRKGGSGPWSLVGIENKKVVAQKINIRDKNLLPAHFEAMRKENPKAKIHIEDAGGQVVWNEKK